jgi:hypothetical protein
MEWSWSAEGTEVCCLSAFGSIRRPQGREYNSRDANAEFLQHPAACDGFSQTFGEFIKFVDHNFPLVFVLLRRSPQVVDAQQQWLCLFAFAQAPSQ